MTAQTEAILYTFSGGADGQQPAGGLVADKAGNLFGATYGGGDANGMCNIFGCGTVFELSPNLSGGYIETVLYAFTGGKDGGRPSGGLAIDGNGNLYGTTLAGGDPNSPGGAGWGTVYELSPNQGGGWTERVIHAFTHGADGSIPNSTPIVDASGSVYGTTAYGGNRGGCGIVFRLTPNGEEKWVGKVLHAFTCGNDGSYPTGPLTLDSSGNVYGVAAYGGTSIKYCFKPKGCGVAFKLHPGSAEWTETVLYNFNNSNPGAEPVGGLTFDSSGNLYGTTSLGGVVGMCEYGCGVVFQLSPSQSGSWMATVLYKFPNGVTGDEGALANGSLVFDTDGNLYGTSGAGGDYNGGQVFELVQNGNNNWLTQIVHSFAGGSDGSGPVGSVIFDNTGNVFGATAYGGTTCGGYCGTVYEITP